MGKCRLGAMARRLPCTAHAYGNASNGKVQRPRPIQCNGKTSTGREQLQGVLKALDHGGVEMDGRAYASLLRQCSSIRSLHDVRRVHRHLAEKGKVRLVENVLLEVYGKCGSPDEARLVFDSIGNLKKATSPFPWNIMMGAYVNNGRASEALELLKEMQARKVPPDRVTFVAGLSACSQLRSLEQGKTLYAKFVATGLPSSVVLDCSLVNMYGRCGRLDEARKLFQEMPERNVVCWNTMIAAYAQNGQEAEALRIYRRMEPEGFKPDRVTFLNVLQACCNIEDLEEGKLVHRHMVSLGLDGDLTMGNAVVNMYGKCGSPGDAEMVFQRMQQRDVVSWNALITAYAQQGYCKEAFETYRSMDVSPDDITFTSVLGAFCKPEDLEAGKAVHARVLSCGVKLNVVLETALLNMYRKCGSLEDARAVFDKMRDRNIITWNAMIAGCVQHGAVKQGLELYASMRCRGIAPDSVTFISVLQLCSSLEEVKQLHLDIKALSLESDAQVVNALVSAYSKVCSLDDSMVLFKSMSSKSVVTWTSMIGACVEKGQGKTALVLYREMAQDGIKADSVACVAALDACTSIGDLVEGHKVHSYINACNLLHSDVFVGTALVNLYGKCGNLVEARTIFDGMQCKNLITWNSMVGAYAQHGYASESLELYDQMGLDGTTPDSITFLSALFACSHIGSLARGRVYFQSMVGDYQVEPAQIHYCCIVDLLARAGWMQDAEELIKNMPLQPGAVAWTTLLGGCKIHDEFERGLRAAEKANELDPVRNSPYLLLSGICGGGTSWKAAMNSKRQRQV